MRGIRRATLALVTIGLTMSGGAAFSAKSWSKPATARHASVKARSKAAAVSPQAQNQPTTTTTTATSRCNSLDAGLDAAIARGPQTGPGHLALENAETVTLSDAGCPAELAVTTLTTTTPASVAAGSPIHDTANLAGGQNPAGSISFTVFPSGNCTGNGIFSSSRSVAGNGAYNSASFTPTTVGSYSWSAQYSGDTANAGSTSACEPFTVTSNTATPSLTTTTPATVAAGSPIHDVAHLAGGNNPTGQIGFTIFSRPDCLGPALFINTVTNVAGNGDYTSGDFTPTTAGGYSWGAFYNGDANNTSAASACEPFTVTA